MTLTLLFQYKRYFRSVNIFLVIPLVLSAFTHIWNPIGFPTIHADENTYMLRSMVALEGKGVLNTTPSFFDHPYFSQIFLASVFGLIGYPEVINPTAGDIRSIEMLHMVPRVLMGVLAVVDTFLTYKIAERRYNRNVAFIAAILFAVMPLSWLLRRILLDNLLLPFLLSSILFSLYIPNPNRSYRTKDYGIKKQVSNYRNINVIIITLLSGIFFGLAIFSKAPAFAMIPLVGFFVYINNNKSWKSLGLWFIPVILIPLIWPAYAASEGLFDNWLQAALEQATGREDEPLIDAIYTFLKIDPALLVLGLAGMGFAIVKRDSLLLLWTVPYLIFLYLVSFVDVIHLVLILPAFCIGTSRMLEEGVKYLLSRIVVRKIKQWLWFILATPVIIFGLISITMLIVTNLNSHYFELYAIVVNSLPNSVSESPEESSSTRNLPKDDQTILVGRFWAKAFLWVSQEIFDKDYFFVRDDSWLLRYIFSEGIFSQHEDNAPLVLIVDGKIKRIVSDPNSDDIKSQRIKVLYNKTHNVAALEDNTPKYDRDTYPYTSMILNREIGEVEIRAN